MLRGLVERKNSEHDERIMMYNVTGDTLRHLGLGHISELPEYEDTKSQLIINTEENDETELSDTDNI
jgi:chromosome segregation and condensation protein ScpB